MDKEEIIQSAIAIGTYETSILPYEDCCVLFSPKHPVLHTKQQDAEDIFARIDIEPLLAEAFELRETKKIDWSLPVPVGGILRYSKLMFDADSPVQPHTCYDLPTVGSET